MRISSVNCGLPFKAQVESTSPLVSGNWEYLQNPASNKTQADAKPKSSFMKKALWAIGGLIVAGALLAWGRNTKFISSVMDNAGTFKSAEGIVNKCKYILGKGGDYAKLAWTSTIGKLITHFKSKPTTE